MARSMPQNKEAEMSVLGVAFLNSSEVAKIVEEVTADMFFDERNKYIFNAIKNMYESKTPIDITTLRNELDKDKKFNAVGYDYLTEVIDSVVTDANLDFYIKIIKDYAVRRNLIETASDIITKTYDEEDVNSLLDNAEKNILNVLQNVYFSSPSSPKRYPMPLTGFIVNVELIQSKRLRILLMVTFKVFSSTKLSLSQISFRRSSRLTTSG